MYNNISLFPRLVACLLAGPLAQRSAPVIQWSLRCLGHLLRALWRPIAADLAPTYATLQPLLALARPDFIRHLAAETLAFLLRYHLH